MHVFMVRASPRRPRTLNTRPIHDTLKKEKRVGQIHTVWLLLLRNGQDGEIAARLGEIASLRQKLDEALGNGQV